MQHQPLTRSRSQTYPRQQTWRSILLLLKRFQAGHHGRDGIGQGPLARPVHLSYLSKPLLGGCRDSYYREILGEQE